MKVSKYLRGSGRFLAFVFVASVLWLLFDMAALRLSNTDMNGQLMRELVLKERELAKRPNLNPTKFRQYPVQKVNPDVEKAQRSDMLRRQVEVYRRKKPDRNVVGNSAAPHLGANIVPKEIKVAPGNDSKAHADTKSHERSDISETQKAPSNKVSRLLASDLKKAGLTKTNAPSVGQEGKRVVKLRPNGTSTPTQAFTVPHWVVLSNTSSSTLKKEVKQEHSVLKDHKTDLPPGETLVRLTPPAHLNASTGELTLRKQAGLHKVMNLDVTLKPRDTRAVGQFGWAAEVPVDDQEESRRRWSEGYFNVFLSEQIPVDRAVPDTRPQA